MQRGSRFSLKSTHAQLCPIHNSCRRYEFSHALVRDVAYRSLLSGKRRELHRLVAEFSGDIDVLKDRHIWRAGHFAAAGEPVPAISLYLDAITALQRRYAYSEIGVVVHDALKLLDSTGDAGQRNEFGALLHMALAESLSITHRLSHSDTRDAYQNALNHASEFGDTKLIVDAKFGVWQHLRSVPKFAVAAEFASELVDRTGTLGELMQARSYHSLGSCHLWLGQPRRAMESLRPARVIRARVSHFSRHELRTAIDESVSGWHLESLCIWLQNQQNGLKAGKFVG